MPEKLVQILYLQACNPKTCVLPFPKIDNLQNGKFSLFTQIIFFEYYDNGV